MKHYLVTQLEFARDEFQRVMQGVSSQEGERVLPPFNSLGFMVAHMAVHEHTMWILMGQQRKLYSGIGSQFGSGAAATVPQWDEVWQIWHHVTREADCEAAIASCLERYGQIDILHNNVGRSRGDREAGELGAGMWDEIHELNVKSYFLCAKHALVPMRAQRSGCIINVSSVSSIIVSPTVAYKTSKAAVNALTHSLAIENARYGIRANAILPGLMDTPMAIERRAREWNMTRQEVRDQRDAKVPLGRKMGTGWDVGHAAVFLASDEARFITGVLLPVDGGQSINTT